MDAEKIKKFLNDGWVILDMPQPEIIHEYVSLLEKKTRELISSDCSLGEIHNYVDDNMFKSIHEKLSEFFWLKEFSLQLGKSFLTILKEIIGLDVMVQYFPYLRLARPGKTQDNIGYHRDTQYGQTPFELAVHIPFVNLDEQSALKIMSGSHRLPENVFSIEHKDDTNKVLRGSIEHKLGKPYSPKKLILPETMQTDHLAMKVGQAAFFSPALFHGQEINSGSVTRVSTDIRFVNPNGNVNIKLGKIPTGYVPIASSPIQKLAAEYYQAQRI